MNLRLSLVVVSIDAIFALMKAISLVYRCRDSMLRRVAIETPFRSKHKVKMTRNTKPCQKQTKIVPDNPKSSIRSIPVGTSALSLDFVSKGFPQPFPLSDLIDVSAASAHVTRHLLFLLIVQASSLLSSMTPRQRARNSFVISTDATCACNIFRMASLKYMPSPKYGPSPRG